MLLKKDVLLALQDAISKKQHTFNINIFLFLLRSTARPLGYPPYNDGVDDLYYLKLLTNKISAAQRNKDSNQMYGLMCSLYQVLACFCYLQESLALKGIDEKLKALLYQAIHQREETTQEEQCAEKSLLAMMFNQSNDLLRLISSHSQRIHYFNIIKLLEEQIVDFSKQHWHRLINGFKGKVSLIEMNQVLSPRMQVLKEIEKDLLKLNAFAHKPKHHCQVTLGYFLLESDIAHPEAAWLQDSRWAQHCMACANKEIAISKVFHFICNKKLERTRFFAFNGLSRETLGVVEKLYQALVDQKKVSLNQKELELLNTVNSMDLNSIYERYVKPTQHHGYYQEYRYYPFISLTR